MEPLNHGVQNRLVAEHCLLVASKCCKRHGDFARGIIGGPCHVGKLMADFRGLDQAIMQLYALEAAPLRVFGQALMRLHASRFAEMSVIGGACHIGVCYSHLISLCRMQQAGILVRALVYGTSDSGSNPNRTATYFLSYYRKK